MYVCTYVYTHVYTHITKRHHGRRGHRARLHMNWWPTLACICACMRDVCCKEHIRGHLLGLHLVVVVFAAPYHKTLHGVKTKKKIWAIKSQWEASGSMSGLFWNG